MLLVLGVRAGMLHDHRCSWTYGILPDFFRARHPSSAVQSPPQEPLKQSCDRYADTGKNIGDYRVVTNFDCHVSLLRFTGECPVLSLIRKQRREGAAPTSVPSMSCVPDAVLIESPYGTGYSLKKVSSKHRMRDMA